MDFKTTSTKAIGRRAASGFTLTEVMFSVGITTLCLATLSMFFVFSTHCFTTLYNYVDLDDANRIAIDQLTRDVRQANAVTAYAANSNSVSLMEADGLTTLTYTYDPAGKTLTRSESGPGVSTSKVVLGECDRLSFVIGQRTPVNGNYEVYPAATPATAKVINVTWSCSRKVFGHQEDTESVQTARIVIRKQGT